MIKKYSTQKLEGLYKSNNVAGPDQFTCCRYYEVLGESLSLVDLLVTNESLGVRPIVMFGDEAVKRKYLSKLSTGECTVAWCLSEERCGSDPTCVHTSAVRISGDQGQQWSVSGSKTWVTSAQEAQLLLVFARTETSDESEGLTCFLIDKSEIDPSSVTISQPRTLAGFRGSEVCDVVFDQCILSENSVLGGVGDGLKIIQAVTNKHKYLQAFPIIKYLKKLLKETIEHCNSRTQFGQPLSEFSLVRSELGKMSAALYALESVAYMTAGLEDAALEPDIEVESVITRQLATDTAHTIITGCLKLLGSQVNLESSKYQQYLRDSEVLQHWQGSANINKCFVAISCLQHLIQAKPGKKII